MMFSFPTAIFISAFLVFQVQPIIARFILPSYGGTPSVWTSCMLFFQVGLLIGYAYAHGLARYVPVQRQPYIHLTLLLLSLLALPIIPSLPENPSQHQTVEILIILSSSVGLPFILLSASAPLLQYWFASTHPNKSPFKLYALSNTGSLLALLSYPFIVEPAVGLHNQAIFWSLAYGVFFLSCILCALPLYKQSINVTDYSDVLKTTAPPTWRRRILWASFSACGSVMLLAITNQLTQNVAAIPFLWVLPLSLYLISFIICFERDRWYRRIFWFPLAVLGLAASTYMLYNDAFARSLSLFHQITIYSIAMLGSYMICHGEIVRKRPTSEYLTLFYLYIALGGALGGIFVNLIAPLIFDGYWELYLVIIAIIIIVAFFSISTVTSIHGKIRYGFAAVAIIMFFSSLSWQAIQEQLDYSILNTRSFYGVLNIYDEDVDSDSHYRSLYHGNILHGGQYVKNAYRYQPITYYRQDSGIDLAIRQHPLRANDSAPMKIGVIGLGTGTIAAFGELGDQFYFYDINPQIERIANEYFTYLDDGKGSSTVILGDGRRSLTKELEKNGSQQFDVLAIDAFTGDAIPIHLLTAEAFDLYWKHIKPNGILAVHTTNIYLDLTDPVRQLAKRSGKEALYIFDDEFYSEWILITQNRQFINNPKVTSLQSKWTSPPKRIIWADDFSNLLEVVKH
ncbi:MAG: hypothetical protein ACJA0C_000214 [Candidatus Endobugula sp.]|jgi:hypothetical protein